jgi:TRAP-type C4-dicarboxylate transport system permease small subunit
MTNNTYNLIIHVSFIALFIALAACGLDWILVKASKEVTDLQWLAVWPLATIIGTVFVKRYLRNYIDKIAGDVTVAKKK